MRDGRNARELVEAVASHFVLSYLDHATIVRGLEGDLEAVEKTVWSLSECDRAEFLLATWRLAWTDYQAYRFLVFQRALQEVWTHKHQYVLAAAGSLTAATNWFRWASFDVAHLPETITVYRGSSGGHSGLSWTTSYEQAAWFAVSYRFRSEGEPCVHSRRVRRQTVLAHFPDDWNENEVVLPIRRGCRVHGTPDEWERLASELNARREAQKSV